MKMTIAGAASSGALLHEAFAEGGCRSRTGVKAA